MAMDARIEWMQMTNPFGTGKKQGSKEKPSASNVADKLRMALTGRKV
nr:hypothetical protein [Pseudomonas putida]